MTIYACLMQEAVVVLEGYLSIIYVQGEQREHPNPTNHEWTCVKWSGVQSQATSLSLAPCLFSRPLELLPSG